MGLFMKKIVFGVMFMFIFSALSFSHSGRTDANGGHYDRSTGIYHYHTKKADKKYSKKSKTKKTTSKAKKQKTKKYY